MFTFLKNKLKIILNKLTSSKINNQDLINKPDLTNNSPDLTNNENKVELDLLKVDLKLISYLEDKVYSLKKQLKQTHNVEGRDKLQKELDFYEEQLKDLDEFLNNSYNSDDDLIDF